MGARPRRPTRILIIDDVATSARDLRTLLEEDGCIVRIAKDCPIAMVMLDGFMPDIALVDLRMLRMDEYALLVHLRRKQTSGEIRLIAIIASHGDVVGEDPCPPDFYARLLTPVGRDQLRRVLESASVRGLRRARRLAGAGID